MLSQPIAITFSHANNKNKTSYLFKERVNEINELYNPPKFLSNHYSIVKKEGNPTNTLVD